MGTHTWNPEPDGEILQGGGWVRMKYWEEIYGNFEVLLVEEIL